MNRWGRDGREVRSSKGGGHVSTRHDPQVVREEIGFHKARVVTVLSHFIDQELKLRGCLCKSHSQESIFSASQVYIFPIRPSSERQCKILINARVPDQQNTFMRNPPPTRKLRAGQGGPGFPTPTLTSTPPWRLHFSLLGTPWIVM